MVDRVTLERVSRDLLFRPVSIISPALRTHLMLVLLEGQEDESLEPFKQGDAVWRKWQGRQWEVHWTAKMWIRHNTWGYHSEGSEFSVLLDLCTKFSAQILKVLTKFRRRIPCTVKLLVPSVSRRCLGGPKICVSEIAQGAPHLGNWVYELA